MFREEIKIKAFIWFLLFGATLIWSGINPKDQFTWLLEVAPALIGGFVLVYTRKTFPLTPLLYVLILAHSLILMVGGHYTYAEVPLFDDFKTMFGFERNNYDKVGHFAQGFVPALIARELLIRKAVVNGRAWLNLYVISFALAFSAFYELIEWGVALISGEDAEAFLGTQSYVWDTQSDMGVALLGAIIAVAVLSRTQDRQISAL